MLDVLRAKMPWPEMFFRDFISSGFALLAVNGLPQLLSALMLFKKHPWAYRVMFACGIILMFWILLEWYVWGGRGAEQHLLRAWIDCGCRRLLLHPEEGLAFYHDTSFITRSILLSVSKNRLVAIAGPRKRTPTVFQPNICLQEV